MKTSTLMILFAGAATLAGAELIGSPSSAAGLVPPPPTDEPAHHASEVAVLAGGCFWGMEGVFEHVRGVSQVTAGYAGGTAETAHYHIVGTETTNHAESIRIVYDPAQVTYGQLLRIYFSAAHDPTQIEGQYPDFGHSYRSAIFPQNPRQRAIAAAYIASLGKAHTFAKPIATRIETGGFFPAEPEHQQFMRRYPTNPYIERFDVERVERLKGLFPTQYVR